MMITSKQYQGHTSMFFGFDSACKLLIAYKYKVSNLHEAGAMQKW